MYQTTSKCSGDFKFVFNATGLENTNVNDAHEALRDEQFNAAALFGELVALGIIPRNRILPSWAICCLVIYARI
jgi:hypothetical protein